MVSCIQMGRLACDPSWNGSHSQAWPQEKPHSVIKVHPLPILSKCEMTQMDGILDVLSVHREHKEAAPMVKQQLCTCIYDERGRGSDRERDRMQLQPLSSAAWLVAIAT